MGMSGHPATLCRCCTAWFCLLLLLLLLLLARTESLHQMCLSVHRNSSRRHSQQPQGTSHKQPVTGVLSWCAVQDAVTVNIGDVLMYVSDDILKSNWHRIRAPNPGDYQGARNTVVYVRPSA